MGGRFRGLLHSSFGTDRHRGPIDEEGVEAMRTRIVVMLAVLVLAGCGGGDDTPDSAAEVREAVTANVEAARDEGDLTPEEEAVLAELEAELEDLLAEEGAGDDRRARFSAYDDTPCVTGATFSEGEGCVVEGAGHFYVDATSGWGEFSTYAWPEADGNYTENNSNRSLTSVGVLAQHDEDIDAWLITLTQGESRPGAGYPACEVDMVLTSNDQGCAVVEVGVFYVDANGRGALNASYWDTENFESSRSDVTKSDLDLDRLGLVVLGTSETGVWTISELPEPGKLYEVIGESGVPITRSHCEYFLVDLRVLLFSFHETPASDIAEDIFSFEDLLDRALESHEDFLEKCGAFGNIEAEDFVNADPPEVFDLADVEARVEEARALIEQARALSG